MCRSEDRGSTGASESLRHRNLFPLWAGRYSSSGNFLLLLSLPCGQTSPREARVHGNIPPPVPQRVQGPALPAPPPRPQPHLRSESCRRLKHQTRNVGLGVPGHCVSYWLRFTHGR